MTLLRPCQFRLPALLGAGLALFALVLVARVSAAEPGLTRAMATAHHPGHPGRMAILVVPGTAQDSPHNAAAHADEEAYRTLLRNLGFDVLTIGPLSRPDLDQALREAARQAPAGGEVAVFVLGTVLSSGKDVYLMPRDAP